MKKLGILVAVIALVGVGVYTQRGPILGAVMARGIVAQMNLNAMADLEDGLHLALCGAGGPMPAPKASGPCVAIVAGDQFYMVDAGTDGVRNLGRMNYPVGQLDGVFVTHFHSDHIDGLGETATLRWAAGANTSPLPVYGPTGVERVVNGFNETYAQDFVYRHEHHGDTVAPTSGAGMVAFPFALPEVGVLHTVVDKDGLKVEALQVEHDPVRPAVGYRFSYKGRSVLVTGDTDKFDNITHFAQGVDILVHEALAPNLVNMMNEGARKIGNPIMQKITYDILDYHASPVEAAETARDAGVGHLLYYHIVPPMVLPGQDVLFLDGAQDIFPDYTIGQDGVRFSLPAGSDEIIKRHAGL
ncbi:MBL fold metallo-hydrolase [Halioglobus pacificus]|uniref:Ribonuclease Z n=1 Tax=Parahalioglobus pacificus TaxID=930806 RepID=A0A919CHC6_9GAMM|nr:MBL fold metallo-hydrolase [Halioglobus pacificus]GHD25258.1 ribonuclease Z [Halioglobus pacificus]